MFLFAVAHSCSSHACPFKQAPLRGGAMGILKTQGACSLPRETLFLSKSIQRMKVLLRSAQDRFISGQSRFLLTSKLNFLHCPTRDIAAQSGALPLLDSLHIVHGP